MPPPTPTLAKSGAPAASTQLRRIRLPSAGIWSLASVAFTLGLLVVTTAASATATIGVQIAAAFTLGSLLFLIKDAAWTRRFRAEEVKGILERKGAGAVLHEFVYVLGALARHSTLHANDPALDCIHSLARGAERRLREIAGSNDYINGLCDDLLDVHRGKYDPDLNAINDIARRCYVAVHQRDQEHLAMLGLQQQVYGGFGPEWRP